MRKRGMSSGTITYPTPVTVNGFQCANCDQVDLAARHVDPLHPRSGAYDVEAQSDPTRSQADKVKIAAQHVATAVPAYSVGGGQPAAMSAIGISIDRQA